MKKKIKKGYIVAIDGPSGAGKSTVSHQLAETLHGRLLDTGAMYRSVAYYALKAETKDEKKIGVIASKLKFQANKKYDQLLVNGEELGLRLRSEKVSQMASFVSQFKKVREVLTKKQRSLAKLWAKKIPVVVEGRDIGTVVFPDVEFKFYVTASAEVRAERRYKQLKKMGAKARYKEILKQIEQRDRQDSHRKLAPLKCASDAVVVDTSSMGIGQVVHFMADHVRARAGLSRVLVLKIS